MMQNFVALIVGCIVAVVVYYFCLFPLQFAFQFMPVVALSRSEIPNLSYLHVCLPACAMHRSLGQIKSDENALGF